MEEKKERSKEGRKQGRKEGGLPVPSIMSRMVCGGGLLLVQALGPRPPRLSLLQRRGRCRSKYFQHELLMGCSDQDSGLSGICPL
jgi:hypothetical protein